MDWTALLDVTAAGPVAPEQARIALARGRELLAQGDIDGGLVGGASLKAADFLQIIAAAN